MFSRKNCKKEDKSEDGGGVRKEKKRGWKGLLEANIFCTCRQKNKNERRKKRDGSRENKEKNFDKKTKERN